MRTCTFVVAALFALLPVRAPVRAQPAADDRPAVKLVVDGEVIPWKRMTVFALPGEAVEVSIDEALPILAYTLTASSGVVNARGPHRWRWTAPDAPGPVDLELTPVERGRGEDAIELVGWVLVPRTKAVDGILNGFRIGEYPAKPLRNNPIYKRPPGFIEVTRDNQDEKLSPHFRLNQFLVKQQAEHWPKYAIVQTKLLIKLEEIVAAVERLGRDVDTLFVMSAYRTPWYNRAIGNTTTFSQHLWGGAADIWVDIDGDGQMDDLNGDRQIDRQDAEVLKGIIVDVERTRPELVGGASAYRATRAHGPFVHTDVRGVPARW